MPRAPSRCLAFARLRLGSRRLGGLWEALFALAVLSTTLPLFAARYVPIQDLPQHVAAVRVLSDYSEPALAFERFFVTDVFATQYLSVYLLASALASVFGALLACKLVLAIAMLSLPYALRALLGELGKPRSFALLALPLAHSVHLVLGFVNFLAGLPLLAFGLALALGLARSPSRARTLGLAAVALVCFYTHVIPFGVLALGASLVAIATRSAAGARRVLLPLAPSALAALVWLFTNPAGHLVASLLAGGERDAPEFTPADRALAELPDWLIDVLPGSADELVLIGWGALVVALFVATFPRAVAPALARRRRALGALVPLAVLAYFVAPASYGFIWPIHARFPLIALLLTIPALPRPGRAAQAVVASLALALSAVATHATFRAFRAAALEESAGLAEIVREVPLGSRVAGLVWARGSRYVRFSPHLHTAAWVQAERGGAVMFSFAEFPHSPFRFRDAERPPRVPPRWEWLPDAVDPRVDLDWYEVVITRSGPARLPGWTRSAQHGAFALWRRAPR